MFEIVGKSFDTEKEYLDFIVENEDFVIETKKANKNKSEAFDCGAPIALKAFGTTTKDAIENEDATEIRRKVIINTTNILDSHKDVHIPGIWDKSLKERGNRIMHLQEHRRTFKSVIARGKNLKAYVETMTWKSLGANMKGVTQALVFDSRITKAQNAEMFNEYRKGNVTEHSVGMQYMKMVTCINSEDYPIQKENWDKYVGEIVNTEALKNTKVFWAQLEAKVIEGSAVLMGSNPFTPTMSNKEEPTEKQIKDKAMADAIIKFLRN